MDNNEQFKFKILSYLGSGTYAQVKKVEYNNQIVAAKIYETKDEMKTKEFKAELKSLKSLSHPNIIKVFASGTYNDSQASFNCLLIEFADMGSLYNVLHEYKYDYTINHAISWLTQISDAVNYLHTLTPKPT
ncbi:unnamed protein product, partial [Brachionus calyciflorus]